MMITRQPIHDSPVIFADMKACHVTHESDTSKRTWSGGLTKDLLFAFVFTVVTCQSSAAPDTIQVMSPETLNQVSNRENTEPLAANPDTIRPFEINVDETAIADLHARLALTDCQIRYRVPAGSMVLN